MDNLNEGLNMGFWRSLKNFLSFGGTRQPGEQSPGPGNSRTAVKVTVDSALQHSAVWACLKIITDSISGLPLNAYTKKEDGTRVPNAKNDLVQLINRRPNRWQTRIEFFATIIWQYVFLGNAYVAIHRNDSGKIIALIPLMSKQMDVELMENGSVVYTYTVGNDVSVYSESSIWHLKGPIGNGIIGYGLLDYAKQSIAIGQAAEQATTTVYQNGGKPSGILSIDKLLSAEQRQRVKENFSGMTDGNQNRLFILEAGMKFDKTSLSPQDIELLASRKFQIEEISRFFGVPSVLINDTSGTTAWGSGIQQIVSGFYKLNLRPIMENLQVSMSTHLLSPVDFVTTELKFDFSTLLRPDEAERMKSYREAINGGIMTPNEARKREGLPAMEGGDSLFIQGAMKPVEEYLNNDGSNPGEN